MSEQLEYNTIEKPSFAEYKEKGSKFLAYAYPLKTIIDFKKHLQLLKKQHPKAVHHCFAYRLGLDGNNFVSPMMVNQPAPLESPYLHRLIASN